MGRCESCSEISGCRKDENFFTARMNVGFSKDFDPWSSFSYKE